MYAAIATCPDIAYAINSLLQFNVKPLKKHWNAVKHIFQYLQGTRDIGITFDMDSGYTDFIISSFLDSDNRKSFHKKAITSGAILLAAWAIKLVDAKKTTILLTQMYSKKFATKTATPNSKTTNTIIPQI